MRRSLSLKSAVAAAILVPALPLLAACNALEDKNDNAAPSALPAAEETTENTPENTPEKTPEETTEEALTPEASSAESTESPESTEPSGSAASSTSSSGDANFDTVVEKAYEQFKSVAPKSLFAQFDDCDPSGIKDSFNCSGHEVGQFQFFESTSKASQTTQLLTELRTSHVVEDSGSRVVGWSTLGSTAVVTVVDNDKGQVMQHMISTDQEDPEEKIESLGLVTKKSED